MQQLQSQNPKGNPVPQKNTEKKLWKTESQTSRIFVQISGILVIELELCEFVVNLGNSLVEF